MDRFCLDCSGLLKGRADKKYCDDQCRSNYNNRLKADDFDFLKSVNQILKKNRATLMALNPDGKAKIKKELLLRKGFDFTYHTHTYATQKGNTYFFCYEYGYLLLAHDEILLVRREDKE